VKKNNRSILFIFSLLQISTRAKSDYLTNRSKMLESCFYENQVWGAT